MTTIREIKITDNHEVPSLDVGDVIISWSDRSSEGALIFAEHGERPPELPMMIISSWEQIVIEGVHTRFECKVLAFQGIRVLSLSSHMFLEGDYLRIISKRRDGDQV